MKLTRFTGGLLRAPVAALLLAATPDLAAADPPFGRGGPGAGGCPPGLAKKNPDCMPPGQYKKYDRGDRFGDIFRDDDVRDYRRDDDFRDYRRDDDFRDYRRYDGVRDYRRGDRIPDFEPFDPFYYREYGLPDPGPGRRYVRIGDQVYLVSEDTHRILEAIRLFGALAE